MAAKDVDFSDISKPDQARLVANTALIAQASGGPVQVFNGRLRGQPGVMIFITNYTIANGEMNELPLVAKEEPHANN